VVRSHYRPPFDNAPQGRLTADWNGKFRLIVALYFGSSLSCRFILALIRAGARILE
jgi:hypothetical protein